MNNLLGKQIEQFRIEELIGNGLVCTVYRAYDTAMRRYVAIKILQTRFKDYPDIRDRFTREGQAQARLKHRNILPVFHYGEYDRCPYLVLPYMQRGSLKNAMTPGRRFTNEEIIAFAQQILAALSVVHNKQIIHRDIKPENILIDDDGSYMLADFGIAKILTAGSETAYIQTPIEIFVGTPLYTALEQKQGKPTFQSDIYSLGIVLYMMLMDGQHPFGTTNQIALPEPIPETPRPMRTYNPLISQEMEQTIFKALERDPARRYTSALTFLGALQHAMVEEMATTLPAITTPDRMGRQQSPFSLSVPLTPPSTPALTPPITRPHRRRWPWLLASVALVLTLIASGTLFAPAFMTTFLPPLATFYPPSTTIRLGTDLPVTGLEKEDGQPVQDGVDMAIQLANRNNVLPGYTLVPDYKDDTGRNDQHDPQVGVQNINTLLQDGLVAGIIGPFNSNVAATEIPLADQAFLPLISPSNTYPCLTRNDAASGCNNATTAECNGTTESAIQNSQSKRSYFRLPTTDDILGKKLADYLFYQQGYRTVSLIEDQCDLYSSGLAQAFIAEWRARGGHEVGTPLYVQFGQTSAAQYAENMQEIAPLKPNLVFFSGLMPDAGYVRGAMARIPGLEKTAFAGGSGIVTSSFADNITSGSGAIFSAMPLTDPSMTEAGQGFQQQFSQSYPGTKYRVYAAAAYDATNLLIQAIKQALTTTKTPRGSWDTRGATTFRQAIVAALRSISYENGVTGNYTFNREGDSTNQAVTIYQLEQSTWQLLPCNISGTCFQAP